VNGSCQRSVVSCQQNRNFTAETPTRGENLFGQRRARQHEKPLSQVHQVHSPFTFMGLSGELVVFDKFIKFTKFT